MQTISIFLPRQSEHFVDEQLASGRFGGADEYILDLIRADQARKSGRVLKQDVQTGEFTERGAVALGAITSEDVVLAIAEIGRSIKSPRRKNDEKADGRKKRYTRDLFRLLSNLGLRYGLKTYTDKPYPSCLTCRPKPPYDLVWRVGSEMILACESEWLNQIPAILKDFKKLLGHPAPFKLLVHRRHNLGGNDDVAPTIVQCLFKYKHHKAGEEYIVVMISDLSGGLDAKSFRVPRDGNLDENEIEFAPLREEAFRWAPYGGALRDSTLGVATSLRLEQR